jgi:hypothetical protein
MGAVNGGWVRYGQETASTLRAEISRAKGSEPLAPVTVVVASNQVGVSVRRQLASGTLGEVCGAGPGIIAVTFLTPYRLAELLGASRLAAAERRPVSTPVLAAAVRTVLNHEPGVFASVAAHPATEAALVSSYRELRDLTDPALEALATRGHRAAEVVRVYRATRARLAAKWYDEEDLMAAATDVASSGQDSRGLGSVIVYLPQRLSRHAAHLLRAVGRSGPLTVIAGSTGVARADAEVTRSVEMLGAPLGPPPADAVLPSVVSTATTRLITASDADDEVRAAVRCVIDAVRAGTSLDRIAVLHASAEPYGRLLHDHLGAAGVAANGAAEVPLAGRLAGRTLLGLLALPDTGYRRQDVFAWITGAPLLHDGRWAPTAAWERISRRAGVVAGRAHWDGLLTHLAEQLDGEAHRIDTEPVDADVSTARPPWRADRARHDAERARTLRSFVLGLIDRLSAATASPRPWGERVTWTKALLHDVLGGPARRERWPEVERRAADRLDVALDRLAALDRIEGPIDLDVFTRTLAVELESDLGRAGRFGEGVLVGPVSMAVGVDLDMVILVGMAEGSFPTTLGEDSLLPDEERQATGGELARRGDHVDRLHHQFLATMSAAGAQTLCVPKGDLRRSRERVPSRWALDVASSLAGERWWSADLLGSSVEWVTHVASFDAGLRRAALPATAQEHRLRRLLAEDPARRNLRATAAVVDATLAAGVGALDSRQGPTLTRFDGNLDGLAIASPIDHGASATRLETWARCPHRYLMDHILRVEPVEAPEDTLQITSLDRGSLVHLALEQFVTEVLDQQRVPDPTEAWSTDDHRRLRAIGGALCDRFEGRGLTGRDLFWRRDRQRILGELDRFLHEDDARRRTTGARPVAAELAFGLDGADPVGFPLGDGRTLAMRGKADRVDRANDGTLHVVDYKTGRDDRYRGLSEDDPHRCGQRLQLAVYAQAARHHVGTPHGEPQAPVRSEYWFTSTTGRFRRHGYWVTDEVLANVGHAMGTIVAGIERGLFPPHPGEPTTSPWVDCPYCDPDGLGVAELRRHWDRKVDDPAMAPYLHLIDPDPTDPESTEPDPIASPAADPLRSDPAGNGHPRTDGGARR